MGMSIHVEAFKPANEKWKKMKAIWDSCEEGGIEIPREVERYFNDEPPDEAGVKVGDWSQYEKPKGFPKWLKRYSHTDDTGFEIDTSKLPEDVTVVRFVLS